MTASSAAQLRCDWLTQPAAWARDDLLDCENPLAGYQSPAPTPGCMLCELWCDVVCTAKLSESAPPAEEISCWLHAMQHVSTRVAKAFPAVVHGACWSPLTQNESVLLTFLQVCVTERSLPLKHEAILQVRTAGVCVGACGSALG